MNRLDSRTVRTVVFSVTGVAFFVYWVAVGPTNSASATQTQWPYILWFSATLLTLTLAVPLSGRMIGGGTWAVRFAAAAGATARMNSAVNIVEDGFGQDWAFLLFALGSAAMLLSLIALAAVLAVRGRGALRLLALIPFGTVAGIVLFVNAGGVILLVTWSAAAAIAMR